VLASLAPPVVVGAGASPGLRVNDVDRTGAATNEEARTAVAYPNADHALAPTREVGDEDVLGAGYARREHGAGGAYPGEFLLDALRDGLDYT
jgi:hypothetical protein